MSAVRALSDDRPRNVRSAATNDPRRSAGVSGRTAEGRRIRDLVESYVTSLGGHAGLSDTQLADVRRAAELKVLAERARAQALQQPGVVDLTALVKLEGAADRAVRRLGLKPGAQTQKQQSLADYVAQKQRQSATGEATALTAPSQSPCPVHRVPEASASDGAGDGG